VMKRLESAGFAREKIDYVLLTHLHVDHVGWNTHWQDGRWALVFPNATYVFGERERDSFFMPEGESHEGGIAAKSHVWGAIRTILIADAVMYLTDAATVTGNTIFVDGGAHLGRW